MKILVFDDNALHRKAAEAQLGEEYDLTIIGTYDEAENVLTSQPDFDIVLTDLMVPASSKMLGGEARKYAGQEMSLGMMIAFLALKQGVKMVGVITDANHHKHPASAALDALGGYDGIVFGLGDARVVFASNFVAWPVDPETAIPLSGEDKKALGGYEGYKNLPSVKAWMFAVSALLDDSE